MHNKGHAPRKRRRAIAAHCTKRRRHARRHTRAFPSCALFPCICTHPAHNGALCPSFALARRASLFGAPHQLTHQSTHQLRHSAVAPWHCSACCCDGQCLISYCDGGPVGGIPRCRSLSWCTAVAQGRLTRPRPQPSIGSAEPPSGAAYPPEVGWWLVVDPGGRSVAAAGVATPSCCFAQSTH